MADLPIIFSAPMVRALLEGRKTQTRRVLKVDWNNGANPAFTGWHSGRIGPRQWQLVGGMGVGATVKTAYATGDRLYVREAWRTPTSCNGDAKTLERDCAEAGYQKPWAPIQYEADGARLNWEWADFVPGRYRHARFMPRWASRLTLTVTDVRVQRLQEISEADAVAEGVSPIVEPDDLKWEHYAPHGVAFRDLWNSLHGPEAWGANPWVAAYSFTVQRGNIDQIGGAA